MFCTTLKEEISFSNCQLMSGIYPQRCFSPCITGRLWFYGAPTAGWSYQGECGRLKASSSKAFYCFSDTSGMEFFLKWGNCDMPIALMTEGIEMFLTFNRMALILVHVIHVWRVCPSSDNPPSIPKIQTINPQATIFLFCFCFSRAQLI